MSDLYWVGPDRLLVDERDDHAGTAAQGQPSTTTKHVYEVDLSHATNLQTASTPTLQCLDALKPTGVTARGVTAGPGRSASTSEPPRLRPGQRQPRRRR